MGFEREDGPHEPELLRSQRAPIVSPTASRQGSFVADGDPPTAARTPLPRLPVGTRNDEHVHRRAESFAESCRASLARPTHLARPNEPDLHDEAHASQPTRHQSRSARRVDSADADSAGVESPPATVRAPAVRGLTTAEDARAPAGHLVASLDESFTDSVDAFLQISHGTAPTATTADGGRADGGDIAGGVGALSAQPEETLPSKLMRHARGSTGLLALLPESICEQVPLIAADIVGTLARSDGLGVLWLLTEAMLESAASFWEQCAPQWLTLCMHAPRCVQCTLTPSRAPPGRTLRVHLPPCIHPHGCMHSAHSGMCARCAVQVCPAREPQTGPADHPPPSPLAWRRRRAATTRG